MGMGRREGEFVGVAKRRRVVVVVVVLGLVVVVEVEGEACALGGGLRVARASCGESIRTVSRLSERRIR